MPWAGSVEAFTVRLSSNPPYRQSLSPNDTKHRRIIETVIRLPCSIGRRGPQAGASVEALGWPVASLHLCGALARCFADLIVTRIERSRYRKATATEQFALSTDAACHTLSHVFVRLSTLRSVLTVLNSCQTAGLVSLFRFLGSLAPVLTIAFQDRRPKSHRLRHD